MRRKGGKRDVSAAGHARADDAMLAPPRRSGAAHSDAAPLAGADPADHSLELAARGPFNGARLLDGHADISQPGANPVANGLFAGRRQPLRRHNPHRELRERLLDELSFADAGDS